MPECQSDTCTAKLTDPIVYPGQFKPIQATELYSSIFDDRNRGCTECGATGMDCPTGSDCVNGLCQRCDTDGSCRNPPKPCCGDSMCPAGQMCDVAKGECRTTPQPGCNTNADCSGQDYCDVGNHVCTSLPTRHIGGGGLGCSLGRDHGLGGSNAAMGMLTLVGLALIGLGRRRRVPWPRGLGAGDAAG